MNIKLSTKAKQNNEMKKIAVITFNYPPYNVTGSFRVMRFVKYLPKYGIIPIVITADQGKHHWNENLLAEIPPEAEVNRFRSIFADSQQRVEKSEKLYEKDINSFRKIVNYILRLVKDFLFSPDVQISWCFLHFLQISKIIKKQKITTVFITGNPFSLFLLGTLLKKMLNLKLLLDFRDPWSEYTDQKNQTFIRRLHNSWMEKFVMFNADAVISVTSHIINALRKKNTKIPMLVIPNGYDLSDYKNMKTNIIDNNKFLFVYAGKFNILDNSYNPVLLLNAFKIFYQKLVVKDVELVVVTRLNKPTEDFMKSLKLNNIRIYDFMTRDKLLKLYEQADAFVQFYYPEKLDIAISIKIFEYAQFRKPILSISSENGSIRDFFNKTNLGFSCENDNITAICKIFEKAYKTDLAKFHENINAEEIEKYNIINQTKILADLIKSVDEL